MLFFQQIVIVKFKKTIQLSKVLEILGRLAF